MSSDDQSGGRPAAESALARVARERSEKAQRVSERAREPTLRRDLDARMEAVGRARDRWVLAAVGLIGLQVLAIVFMQAPWTEREMRSGPARVSSGWETISTEVPGGGWVLLSLVCLAVSLWATFVALGQRSSPACYVIMAASAARIGTIALVLNSSVVGVDDRSARYGAVLSILVAIATFFAAEGARPQVAA